MKFNFIVSKWANFYFFVSNLSEWHFSNQKDYNILWRKELGSFSPEEENTIKQFKEIHLRYPFGKLYLGRQFFLENNPWVVLEQKLLSEDFINLKNIFSLLNNKFDSLYENDLSLLNRWQENLNKFANNEELANKILLSLNALYKNFVQKKEVNVYLLFSTSDHTGGGVNIDSKNISLEISRYPAEGVSHAIGIIWHEIIHSCFQKQYFFPMLLKQFPNDKKKVDLINEIVAATLFPSGMLGIRLLKNKPAAKLYPGINEKQTIELLNLTKEYLDQKKHFNEDYIKRISLIIKEGYEKFIPQI